MQTTTDYGIFKNIDGNRKVNKSHVSRLVQTIERKNLLEYFPILCNEDMEVIDGQHRLSAAIQLKLSVPYAKVNGLRIEDVMEINTNSKSWTMIDFINSWIALGHSDYMILKNFIETHNINPSTSAAMLAGFQSFTGGSVQSKKVRDGSFKVASLSYAEKIASQLHDLKKYCSENMSPFKDREFICALMRLNTNEDFDFERFLAKLKLHDLTIEKRANEKYYILEIEELYNFRNSIIQDLYKSSYEHSIVRT